MAPQRPLSVIISVDYLLLGIKIEKVEKFHLKMTKITINPLQCRKRSFVLKNVSKTEKKRKNMILLLCTFLRLCLKMEHNCSAKLKQ